MVGVKAWLSAPVLIAILVCITHAGEAVAPGQDMPEEGYRLAWKLPVGDLMSAAISHDGQRILLPVHSDGHYLYDSNGRLIWRLPDPRAKFGALSADGSSVVLASGDRVSSIDARTLQEEWNYTLPSDLDSMSMSDEGGLVAVSGVWTNHTFIYTFDSQGNQLWKQSIEAEELGDLHVFLYVHANLAVSDDGSYIAAAMRETSARYGSFICVGRNGVILFDKDGRLAWNFTTSECVSNVAISEGGRHVAAGSDSHVYVFAIGGQLLWSRPVDHGVVAVSKRGERFVGGDAGGALLLGNSSGPYWEMDVDGSVDSVAVSERGDISASIISRDSPDGRTVRLIYVLTDTGRLIGNYSFVAPTHAPSYERANRVAISGDGCCIVAALETDGIYYFVRIPAGTQTLATATGTETLTVSTSTTTPSRPGAEEIQIITMAILVVTVGLIALLFAVRRISRPRIRVESRPAP